MKIEIDDNAKELGVSIVVVTAILIIASTIIGGCRECEQTERDKFKTAVNAGLVENPPTPYRSWVKP